VLNDSCWQDEDHREKKNVICGWWQAEVVPLEPEIGKPWSWSIDPEIETLI
jgi:hypothetical protein